MLCNITMAALKCTDQYLLQIEQKFVAMMLISSVVYQWILTKLGMDLTQGGAGTPHYI